MSRKLFGSHGLLLNSWDCLKQSTNPSVMSGNISHVTRKVVLTDQESAPPAPPPKMRRRLSGKTAPSPLRRPVAIFGGGDFPQAAAAPGPGLLRQGHQPQPSPRLTLQGPPLQKAVVEAVSYIERPAGLPALGSLCTERAQPRCPRIFLQCLSSSGPPTAAHCRAAM